MDDDELSQKEAAGPSGNKPVIRQIGTSTFLVPNVVLWCLHPSLWLIALLDPILFGVILIESSNSMWSKAEEDSDISKNSELAGVAEFFRVAC